jgi:hypothetical protein
MNKEFIPYEESLALKELGFDEPCILLFRGLDTQPVCQMGYEFKTARNSEYGGEINYWITVPTFSQAFRWFRDNYGLNHEIPYAGKQGEYHAFVQDYVYGNNGTNPSVFTYEEAELECLKRLIEIVKQNR